MNFPKLKYWRDIKLAAESDKSGDKVKAKEISAWSGESFETCMKEIKTMRNALKGKK